MTPSELKLFYSPKERLRLTIGEDRSYHTVKPVWAAPLTRPGKYLTLLDGKGAEIAMVEDLSQLPQESLAEVEYELRQRYLTATISSILSARQEYGATYWRVTTDRGEREFVTQNLQENAMWISDTHLMLLDVDGNRFEITDTAVLDPRSRGLIHAIL